MKLCHYGSNRFPLLLIQKVHVCVLVDPPERERVVYHQVLLFGTTVSSWSDSFLVSETQIWRKVVVLSTPIFSINPVNDVVVICSNLIFVSGIWQCGKKQGAVMSYKSNRVDRLCNHVCILRGWLVGWFAAPNSWKGELCCTQRTLEKHSIQHDVRKRK
jgi:uncharacterized membrane protein YbjE (DUF340 family)